MESIREEMDADFQKALDGRMKQTIFNLYQMIHSLEKIQPTAFEIQESDKISLKEIGVRFIQLAK